jgi:hypothetical protein
MVYMLLAQRYVVPVHAACVAREGSGVLLCGNSGAGKSTLSFACARAGWTFLTDESTWLLPDAEDRTAIGRPYLARFREDALRIFPELRGFAARARPNGKFSIEAPLSAFPNIRTASRCPIGCLVLLDRQCDGAARAESISTSAIVEQFLREMPSYGEDVDALVERAMGRLRSLPAYRLTYGGLEEAVSVLEGLKYA